MISHEHKCIFIHIAKCAGSSIVSDLGIDINDLIYKNDNSAFGWDEQNKIWLQHATPQQLIDLNYISNEQWDSYYKFIVYRNTWDKCYSDYLWMLRVKRVKGSFYDYLYKRKDFKKILTEKYDYDYAGDHLYKQKSYFFLNGKEIKYDKEINFDKLDNGLKSVAEDLNLDNTFFSHHINKGQGKKDHYSKFYNFWQKWLVYFRYKEDIDFFNFKFVNK
ncbi:hypothetical protein RBH94_01420 [Aestuariibaculum sp. YM273]|uniref:hypothetical protein n=1 Tax=Aestuariibaculum sp. YM273 TaxID=3070659 RepID=UPI0027DAFAD8|nr:hypothetical protein [Aestuariibaculum sp. YM273]WMI65834.1 hypothetical protein RBH94_01420 [Aestuariibaculum sp. YM273]